MRLCSQFSGFKENVTLISFDIGLRHIMKVEFLDGKYQIVGIVGKCIDNILCSVKNRVCEIIGEKYLGKKLDNGTYTGAIGHIQSGRGEPEKLFDEPFLGRSLPLRAENIWASQIISDKNFDYFDLLENFIFSWQIYLGYFVSFISFTLICFLLLKFKMRSNENYLKKNLSSKLLYNSNYLKKSNELSFKSILLFFGLFLWFTLLFLTNTIKTNKVVVDTSELIKNRDELMKSDLVCFFEEDTAYNLARNSPKNSFLFKLFDEKTKLYDRHKEERRILKADRCMHKRKESSEYSLVKKNKILLLTQIETSGAIIIASELGIAKKIWILKQGIDEYMVVIYYKKKNSDLSKSLEKFSLDHIEHGLTKNMYACMADQMEFFYRKSIKVYKDIDEYIDDYIGFKISPIYLPILIDLYYDYFY